MLFNNKVTSNNTLIHRMFVNLNLFWITINKIVRFLDRHQNSTNSIKIINFVAYLVLISCMFIITLLTGNLLFDVTRLYYLLVSQKTERDVNLIKLLKKYEIKNSAIALGTRYATIDPHVLDIVVEISCM